MKNPDSTAKLQMDVFFESVLPLKSLMPSISGPLLHVKYQKERCLGTDGTTTNYKTSSLGSEASAWSCLVTHLTLSINFLRI